MNQYFDSDYRRDRISSPYESLFAELVGQQPISKEDFITRIDVCVAIAAFNHAYMNRTMLENWDKIFPEVKWNESYSQKALTFARECRLGLKIMSDNEDILGIQKLKSLASIGVLIDLATYGSGSRYDEINKRVSDAASDVIGSMSTYSSRVYEVLLELFGDRQTVPALNEQTRKVLSDYKPVLEELFDAIHSSFRRLNGTRTNSEIRQSILTDNAATGAVQEPVQNHPQEFQNISSIRIKAVKYANAACLLEACVSKERQNKYTLEKLFAENWMSVFKSPCMDIEDIYGLIRIVQNDKYLQSVEKLLTYSVRELRSDILLRKIVVARCVNRALSVVPRDTNADSVLDEALELYSGVNILSIGKEESDIRSYLGNYLLSDGTIDGRAIEIFREHKKMFNDSLEATKQGISESKTRNRYVDTVVDEKDKQIAGLQEQLDNTQFSSLYKLTDALTNHTYGYLLGRVYRVANGFDEPDTDKMVGMCVDLLQIFRSFGIAPTHEDSVGLPDLLDSENESNVIYDNMTGINAAGIIFPGWRVKDDIVALPVSASEEPADD